MSDNASYQISEGGCDNGAAVKDYDVQVVEGGSRENRWERLHRRSYWLTYVVIPLITLSHIASGHPWKQTLNPKKQRLRSVWYVQAGYCQGMCPNPKVFDVIVDCLLKVAGYGSGLVGVGAGEKPIAQAGNAIFHVHYEL